MKHKSAKSEGHIKNNKRRKVYITLICLLAVIVVSACFLVSALMSGRGDRDNEVLDLMALNTLMRNARIHDIQTRPEEYIGTRMIVSGQYHAVYSEILGRYRHLILLPGGDACCPSVAIEFVREGDHAFPDDYPEFETMVHVQGVLSTFRHWHEESEILYIYLEVEEIDW